MASPSYLALQNITDAIENHLNKYLAEAGFKETYDKETVEEMQEKHAGSIFIESPVKVPNPKGGMGLVSLTRYIFVPASIFRNNQLTAERIANTLLMLNEIKKILDGTQENIAEDVMKTKLAMLQENLRSGLAKNNEISKSHKKYHCSWKQSTTMNLNIFSTWWNTSWRKSRATYAFERCLGLLKGYVPAETSQIRHKSK